MLRLDFVSAATGSTPSTAQAYTHSQGASQWQYTRMLTDESQKMPNVEPAKFLPEGALILGAQRSVPEAQQPCTPVDSEERCARICCGSISSLPRLGLHQARHRHTRTVKVRHSGST